MIIYDLKINHIINPMGFMYQDAPVVSYKIKEARGKRQISVQIKVAADKALSSLLYNSEDIKQSAAVYSLPFQLEPTTRYYVSVEVCSDAGERAQAQTWFETGKMNEPWSAKWITSGTDGAVSVLGTEFVINKPINSARAFVSSAGLYRMDLNGTKSGNEYLTPYCNDYDSWMQVITHDVTEQMNQGRNLLEITLAPGWYKGRFGFRASENIYGDTLGLIMELHISYEDGTQQIIVSDDSWYSRDSWYENASIYDGAIIDFGRDTANRSTVKRMESDMKAKLKDRLSLPVVVKNEFPVMEVIRTPKGELCLDFGQNMSGFLRIDTSAFAASDFTLKYFEVLDSDGNFFNDNLRTAKQEFIYRSDGQARIVEPEFTYYGFRYVMVEGLNDIPNDSFTACAIHSDLEQTGNIETSNPLVNKLFHNTLWSQKDNFVDVPTDCPQRDERLGWTGDAQVFCGTACYNTDATAFWSKYMYDVYQEQKKYNGSVPFFVPTFNFGSTSSAAWGDAATVIPWTVYLHSGDKTLLVAQYPAMKAWVEYIRSQETENHLWQTGFHFGDWLALDNANPEIPSGMTPPDMIASAYYLYSACLTANAAKALEKADDYDYYTSLADKIRASMQKEYVTEAGRIASDTQTANVIALFMEFTENTERAASMLNDKVMSNGGGHLSTGFVGTAYLCRALSDYGYNDTAYKLLLNKDYPSWLYAVERGATTIWERWNSIMPDGTLTKDMNSFNHYAYGAVMEWMYRNVGGLQPLADGAGFRQVKISPQPSSQMEWYKMVYNSACGQYRSEWCIEKNNLRFVFEIPFDAQAQITLPDAPETIFINGEQVKYTSGMVLDSGIYAIDYAPTKVYYTVYNLNSDYKQIISNPKLMAILSESVPAVTQLPPEAVVMPFTGNILEFLSNFGILVEEQTQSELNEHLSKVRAWN